MLRRSVFVVPLALIVHGLMGQGLLLAGFADGNPRLQQLYRSFIAPCCWRENLLTHHSPKADELRAGIARRVSRNQSDEEIKSALIAEYSLRILSMPEGARAQWLSWTPVAAALAGLWLVIVVIRKSLASRPAPAGDAANLSDLPDLPDLESTP